MNHMPEDKWANQGVIAVDPGETYELMRSIEEVTQNGPKFFYEVDHFDSAHTIVYSDVQMTLKLAQKFCDEEFYGQKLTTKLELLGFEVSTVGDAEEQDGTWSCYCKKCNKEYEFTRKQLETSEIKPCICKE